MPDGKASLLIVDDALFPSPGRRDGRSSLVLHLRWSRSRIPRYGRAMPVRKETLALSRSGYGTAQ